MDSKQANRLDRITTALTKLYPNWMTGEVCNKDALTTVFKAGKLMPQVQWYELRQIAIVYGLTMTATYTTGDFSFSSK